MCLNRICVGRMCMKRMFIKRMFMKEYMNMLHDAFAVATAVGNCDNGWPSLGFSMRMVCDRLGWADLGGTQVNAGSLAGNQK